jgi:hypothetical protein
MRYRVIWLTGLVGATLVLPPSLPQTCITRENSLLDWMETTCPDGTTAISRYDALLDRWETTIQPGPQRVVPVPQPPGKREHR